MKLLIGALLNILLVSSFSAQGLVPEEATFGLKQDSTEWKRIEMEEWMVTKLSSELERFVPREHFAVYADVMFKAPEARVVSVTEVHLAKFGQVATVVRGERSRPELGAFDKISRLDLTLVVSQDISESTVQAMLDVLKARVPVVDKARIATKMYRMSRPPATLQSWVREVQPLLLLAVGLGVVGMILILLLQRVRVSWSWNMAPAERSESTALEASGNETENWAGNHPPKIPLEALVDSNVKTSAVREDFPEADSLAEANALVDTHDHHVRIRKLRNILLTLSVAECAQAAKADPHLAAVMSLILPASRTREILARLTESERKQVYKTSLGWSEKRLADEAVGIAEKIKGFRRQRVDETNGGYHALATYVEQMGAQGEDDFYQSLIETGRCQDLAVIAHWVPPSAIIENVSDELLFGFWTRLHLKDRLELLAYADIELSQRLLKKIEHKDFSKKAHFEHRMVRLRQALDPSRRSEMAYVAWNRLLAVARNAYRQSTELQAQLHDDIDAWLWTRTKGVVGVQPKKQKQTA